MHWMLFGFLIFVGTCASLAAIGRWHWTRRSHGLLARLDASRIPAPTAGFDPQELDTLPPPVARYLRLVLPAGARIIRAVDLAHEGSFNLSQSGERWRYFNSRQHVVTRRPGFLWDARISMMPGLPVHVHDAYVDGEGILAPAIGGLIPLGALRDRDEVARGELMRLLAEAAWYPTFLLPGQGLRWEAIDERNARATLVDGPLSVTMNFQFDEHSLIETIRTADRGRMVEGKIVPTPWEGRLFNYQRHDGMLIPVEAEVAWLTKEGRMPYWRGKMLEIAFHY